MIFVTFSVHLETFLRSATLWVRKLCFNVVVLMLYRLSYWQCCQINHQSYHSFKFGCLLMTLKWTTPDLHFKNRHSLKFCLWFQNLRLCYSLVSMIGWKGFSCLAYLPLRLSLNFYVDFNLCLILTVRNMECQVFH